jgi:CxxC-x17-CxxC domain-containing protein
MAQFERSRESSPRKNSRGRQGRDNPRGRDRRGPKPDFRKRTRDRERGESVRTKVTCSACGEKCEVPFKPTSSKPVFCNACFANKGKNGEGNTSEALEMIHEKLDKIMKALDIE